MNTANVTNYLKGLKRVFFFKSSLFRGWLDESERTTLAK